MVQGDLQETLEPLAAERLAAESSARPPEVLS